MSMSRKTSAEPGLVCLTGGIATGKTRVADWFAAGGWRVICTDAITHQLYEPGQPLTGALAREFSARILDGDGRVNRGALAEIVFRDADALRRLNALVHPRVRETWQARAIEGRRDGKRTMVVIPLAYEADVVREFDQVWVVACSRGKQEHRLRERRLTDEQIARRIASQWPLQKKIDLADIVIWNEGAWSITEEQLNGIFPRADGLPQEAAPARVR